MRGTIIQCTTRNQYRNQYKTKIHQSTKINCKKSPICIFNKIKYNVVLT